MNRRLVLKQIAVATAAAYFLPSCVADPKKVSIALQNLKITGDEEELLGEIADTIIPTNDTPGAKAVGAHHFTLVMVDDCMSKADQEKYLKGMRSFDEKAKEISGKTFIKQSAEERLKTLSTIEKEEDKLTDELKTFYFTTKGYTLHGYQSSQHFLTAVKPYKHVPGPNFKGCVPVTENQLS
jgi:hypothetical protein